ncbi:MAG: hypothetical protein IT535_08365 [Bauldia sp.]|nr:hypothetical protein [Bauldia sp.]
MLRTRVNDWLPARRLAFAATPAGLRLALAALLLGLLPSVAAAQVIVPIPTPRPDLPGAPAPAPSAGTPAAAVEGLAGGGTPLPLDGGAPLPLANAPSGTPMPGAPLPLGPVEPGAPIPLVGPPSATVDLPLNLNPPSATLPAGPTRDFSLAARLTQDGPTISNGLTWRVFGTRPGPDGKLPLVGEAEGGVVDIPLADGAYFVHAAYGRAGVTKQVVVPGATAGDTLVLDAGGLRFDATLPDGTPLPSDLVNFDIYLATEGGEGFPVLTGLKSGEIVPLNAGTYQIVSRYGDANAQVSADITVEAGKLTEAIMYHQAARLTLKLVSQRGGEALANTAWSVITPGGEQVFESVGAFPTVVLASGDYVAIARHEDHIYESGFTVTPDLDRDVEVLAQNPSDRALVP